MDNWEAKYGDMTQEDVDAELLRQGIMSAKDFYTQAEGMGAEATTAGYLQYAQAQMAGHEEELQEPRVSLVPVKKNRDVVGGLKHALGYFKGLVDKRDGQRLLAPGESSSNGEPVMNVLPAGEDPIELPGEVPEKEEPVSFRETWTRARNKRVYVRMDYTDAEGNRTFGRWELPLSITENYVQAFSWTRYPEVLAKHIGKATKAKGGLLTERERQAQKAAAHRESIRTYFIREVRNLKVTDRVADPRERREGQVLLAPKSDSVIAQKPMWVSEENAARIIASGNWEAIS